MPTWAFTCATLMLQFHTSHFVLANPLVQIHGNGSSRFSCIRTHTEIHFVQLRQPFWQARSTRPLFRCLTCQLRKKNERNIPEIFPFLLADYSKPPLPKSLGPFIKVVPFLLSTLGWCSRASSPGLAGREAPVQSLPKARRCRCRALTSTTAPTRLRRNSSCQV
jgi:hypothetical protein